jgi:hypothetical protein
MLTASCDSVLAAGCLLLLLVAMLPRTWCDVPAWFADARDCLIDGRCRLNSAQPLLLLLTAPKEAFVQAAQAASREEWYCLQLATQRTVRKAIK